MIDNDKQANYIAKRAYDMAKAIEGIEGVKLDMYDPRRPKLVLLTWIPQWQRHKRDDYQILKSDLIIEFEQFNVRVIFKQVEPKSIKRPYYWVKYPRIKDTRQEVQNVEP